MIVCPACSHWSWVEKYEEPYITKTKPKETFYTWNSCRFYGAHFVSNKGNMALVNHSRNFLNNGNYNIDQEIYFRRLMWWAFNDFVRNRHQISIDCYTSKEMSFKVWYRNRKKILEGIELFNKCRDHFNENLRNLIDLYKLRYTPDDEEYESVNLDIIEIYRQLGEFENAKALLEQTTRRTHFISTIERKVDEQDDLVFLVSG